MNSPKTRFLASGKASDSHRKYVDSTAFEQASDAALIQMAEEMVIKDPPIEPSRAWHLIEGAIRYRRVLAEIADYPQKP